MSALFLPSREASLAVLRYSMQRARRDGSRQPVLLIETTPGSDVLPIVGLVLGHLRSCDCLGVLMPGQSLLILLDGHGSPFQLQRHLDSLKTLLQSDVLPLSAHLRFEARVFPEDGASDDQLLRPILSF